MVGHEDDLLRRAPRRWPATRRALRRSSRVVGSSSTSDRRVGHEHRGQREQLLLAAGEQVGGVVGVVGELEPRQDVR